jgi:hypothetical protein
MMHTNTGAVPARAEVPIHATAPVTHYRTATIDGVSIFYREAGPADGPVSLLLHLLDTGHFALEDKLDEMAPLIRGFLDDNVAVNQQTRKLPT